MISAARPPPEQRRRSIPARVGLTKRPQRPNRTQAVGCLAYNPGRFSADLAGLMQNSIDRSDASSNLARAWTALEHQHAGMQGIQLQDLFRRDPDRARRYRDSACGLYLDFSKNRIVDESLEALLVLAGAARLESWIEDLFSGRPVNASEQRPALHMALRAPPEPPFPDPDHNLMPAVHGQLAKLEIAIESLRCGQWRGFRGEAITDVVNLGIGGSDLGPRMVCAALADHNPDAPRCHFVSNLDADDLYGVLDGCDPGRTLFVVASKSFTTEETLLNAHSARRWLQRASGAGTAAIAQHFVAVSAQPRRCIEFGITEDNIYRIWDWVGGRYSLWSSIGFSIAARIGVAGFRELLAGARAMDEHFRHTPLRHNLPVLLALMGIWNRNLEGAASQVVLPYDHALRHFPEFLQQLEMESNGKSCSREGEPVEHASTPVLWGSLGNNAQHAFSQFLHQGSDVTPAEFIVPIFGRRGAPDHEQAVLAHALAQAAVMLSGHDAERLRQDLSGQGVPDDQLERLAAQRQLAGNRPSNMLIYERLDARTLGALIALYEHKVFVQGVCWQINSFDQWGVERGKQVARELHGALAGEGALDQFDASTGSLIRYIHEIRGPTRS